MYDSLPISCLGTLSNNLSISFLVGTPSCKVNAASHLVAITLSDLSSFLILFAKQTREYVLLFFEKE